MKREKFEKRCEEMRRSAQRPRMPVTKPVSAVRQPNGDRRSLKDAASALGVSYWTARRILIAENVGRYSTAGETPVYPATTLRKFQRVRMTYLVTDADIDRVKKKMRGEEC
ncbi:MAG TPA: hypothetical protein VG273_00910 [Bryobacteraceae bacterium]|nr:hypothetical protein [Bryobacteraceae bacterium]